MTIRDRQVLSPPEGSPPPGPAPYPDYSEPPPPQAALLKPWVSYGVIAACVAAFLYGFGSTDETGASSLYRLGVLYGPLVRESGEWFRVFSTVFTHAGPLHLIMNMSVMWTLGAVLERNVQSWRFLLISGVTAMGSAAVVLLFAYDKPTVGASGMILGYLGAMLPIATQQGRKELLTWLVQIAIISLFPGISWQGHLGGFLFGLPMGWALRGGAKRFSWAGPAIFFGTVLFLLAVGSGSIGVTP